MKPLIAFPDFQSLVTLENLYDIKRPTAKKIVKLIKSELVTDQERQCLDHFKKYIRSLQGSSLSLFLQFITGSDIISCDSIEVTFSALEGTLAKWLLEFLGIPRIFLGKKFLGIP